jgi:acyl-CoA dehydrogenase
VDALTRAGWLAALIPQAYGGSGLGLAETSVILEEIKRSGGNAAAGHRARGTAAAEQERHRARYRHRHDAAQGHGRPYSRGRGDRWVVNGQKVWISRVQHSDPMVLLARTTPLAQVAKKSQGLEIPHDKLVGEEGQGFRYILDGLNAERTLIAAECIGDGRWFIDRVTAYAKQREVFGRPIGQNQGVQFPIAEAHIEVEAADLMRWQACQLFDAHQPCGAQANMAKYLAAKASWEAANAAIQFHGGFGFACEYDVERKFRETRLYQVAPISTNLILSYVAEHVLGLPRSF